MKMRNKLLLAIATVLLSSTRVAPSGEQLNKAMWLIGTWEMQTSRGRMYETWTVANPHALTGRSYMLKEKDTVVLENVRLVEEAGSLFYIPTVSNQNGGLPVRFALHKLTDLEMVFTNPQHDFPQVIAYTRKGTDSLVAQVSGKKNGQEKVQTFTMRKTK